MRIDWTDYLRVHAERRNLLIHLIAVPLFVGSVVSLFLYLIRGDYVSAVILIVLAFGAMAMQGRGHALEPEPPRPFSSPVDFLRRWFTEQFYIFPVFLLSGRWWQQLTSNNNGPDDAA